MRRIGPFLIWTLWAAGPAVAETPWEAYLALPSPENAALVHEIEYSPNATREDRHPGTDLEILSLQVVAGDSAALRLSFRLLGEVEPGHLAEELTDILARAVRAQPRAFLREVAALQPESAVLQAILVMTGDAYVDRPEAQRYERDMRRKALSGVKDPELRKVCDQCLLLMGRH